MRKVSIGNKILVTMVAVVLVGLLAFCAWWVTQNGDKVQAGLDGTKIYTQQEYEEAYNKGVEDGALIKTEQERLIANLKKQVDNLNTSANALRADIAQKDAQIASQSAQATQDASTIASLQAEITRLNNLVAQLQQDIDFYIAKIEELQTENEVAVYFVLDDAGSEIHYTKIVDKGTTLADETVVAPQNTTYKNFVGWSLDKTNVVSISAQAIEQDTTFYAVWEDVAFDVVFKNYDGTVLSSQVVAKSENPNAPFNPSHTDINHVFDYWTPDGATVVYSWNISKYVITQNTTFVATFREIDPYLRVIVDGKLRYYEEKSYMDETFAEQGLTASQVYPVIYGTFDYESGGFDISAGKNMTSYDIIITTTETHIYVTFADQQYTYAITGEVLILFVEYYIISEGCKDDSINHEIDIDLS